MAGSGNISGWGLLIFLAVFLVTADILAFAYSQQTTTKEINVTSNETYNSNETFSSNSGVVSSVKQIQVTVPVDFPWGLKLFLTLMNLAVFLLGFVLIRSGVLS